MFGFKPLDKTHGMAPRPQMFKVDLIAGGE
jgi:hypothetical protein